MPRGLRELLKGSSSMHIVKDVFQVINSVTSPRESARLYKFLIDAIRHGEFSDPQGVKDYSRLREVVIKNEKKIEEARKLGENPDTHPNLVLLVVGHLETPSMYYGSTDFFRQHGIDHIYWIPLHHFRDTADNVDYFLDMARDLLKLTGKKKIDVIAHSRGGLVTSYTAMARPEEFRKFNKIINVGTPFHGTMLADIGYWALEKAVGRRGLEFIESRGYSLEPVREMMYCSDFTEKVSSCISHVNGVRFYSVFSLGYDEAVIPGECSIIDSNNFLNISVDDYLGIRRTGHVGLAMHKKVLELELDILKDRFDEDRFRKEHSIISFEEYRQERHNGRRMHDRWKYGQSPMNLFENLAVDLIP